MTASALRERVARELHESAPLPAQVLAEAIRERHGDVVAAVLFYGSCLRKATHEGVLDFYVIVDDYVANRKADEIFNDYVDRIGVEAYEGLLAPVSTVPPLDKDSIQYYIDWNRDVLYKVERGEGECAA